MGSWCDELVLRCVDNSPQLLVRKKSSSPQQKLYNSIRSQRTFSKNIHHSLLRFAAILHRFARFDNSNKTRLYQQHMERILPKRNAANNTILPQFCVTSSILHPSNDSQCLHFGMFTWCNVESSRGISEFWKILQTGLDNSVVGCGYNERKSTMI